MYARFSTVSDLHNEAFVKGKPVLTTKTRPYPHT